MMRMTQVPPFIQPHSFSTGGGVVTCVENKKYIVFAKPDFWFLFINVHTQAFKFKKGNTNIGKQVLGCNNSLQVCVNIRVQNDEGHIL